MCAGFFLAAIWSRSWRLPITGVVPARRHRRRRRRHLPGADPVAQGQPVGRSRSRRKYIERNINATRAAFGLDRVKRIQNPTPAETENKAVLRAAANDIPGVRIIDPNVVAPTFRQLAGPARLLRVPRHPRRRPLHDRQADPRRRRRGARDQPRGPARQPAQLAQRPHRLHPRLRLLRGLRQPAHDRGRPGLLRGWRPQRDRRVRAARSTSASSRRPTPSSAPRRVPRRGSSTTPPAARATSPCRTPTPATAACRSARRCAGSPTRSSTARPTSCSRMPSTATPASSTTARRPSGSSGSPRGCGSTATSTRPSSQGRVQWIVDGFTTSANYPNSRLIELAEATSDSVAQRSNVVAVGAGQVNYVRNAVKATVDAYTATSSSTAGTPRTRCSRRGATRSRARCGRSRRSPAT